MFVEILILIFGFTLLISGANALVNGASNIAKKFHIPEILIGLTIVALGTSLPELVVTIVSSTTNSTDIIVGNVIGSNICNLLFILGIIAILKPIKFEKSTIKLNLPLLIILTALVLTMGLGLFSETKLVFTNSDGIILLIIALIYFIYPIIEYIKIEKATKKSEQNEKVTHNEKTISNEEQSQNKNNNLVQNIIYILLGGFALKYGGDFVVSSTTAIATSLHLPERVISLTIVALGTSLPELVTSIVAILKNDDELAEGNIIGSCIINFCLILGLGAILSDLPITTDYIENLILLLASSILIWLYSYGNKNNTITRSNGAILLIIYLIYSILLFI